MAAGDISGAAIASFELDDNTGTATDLKGHVTEVHIAASRNAVDDTRVGDTATRMRTLKPTHSMTVSVRPHYTLVDILYGDQAANEKDVELVYHTNPPTNSQGIKVTGKVVITDVPDFGLMASGNTGDVQFTLSASDGAGFTITSVTT